MLLPIQFYTYQVRYLLEAIYYNILELQKVAFQYLTLVCNNINFCMVFSALFIGVLFQ